MAHLAHYREAHPLPFRITHWVNLISMILLIVTGFCIHFPFWPEFMGIARGVHIFLGFVIAINAVVRVILAFFVKSSPYGGSREMDLDVKGWLPQSDNKHQLIEWIKYYLFLRKTHPLSAKLGVPQKLRYLAVAPLLLFMFFTGLCLWSPTANLPFFADAVNLFGGAMSMRIVHYFMMYLFICFTLLHAYLANIEGLALTNLMFFGKEHGGMVYDPQKHTIVGEDHMGHDEKSHA